MSRTGRKALQMTVVGLGTLLMMTGAMAKDDNAWRGGRDNQGPPPVSAGGRHRVLINGKEDRDLSQRAMKVGTTVMVPSDRLFQVVGGDVKRQHGWAPPGSQQPNVDRDQDWYVVQHGGRELRYRPNERMYYYGGVRHYFTTPPYERDGNIFLALADIAQLFGGTYNYDDRYYDDRVTIGEPGYWPAPNELRLTYPYSGQRFGNDNVLVEGYAPPSLYVRVTVVQEGLLSFLNRNEFTGQVRASRNGVFSIRVPVRRDGDYHVNVDLLDEYGRVANSQRRDFSVR